MTKGFMWVADSFGRYSTRELFPGLQTWRWVNRVYVLTLHWVSIGNGGDGMSMSISLTFLRSTMADHSTTGNHPEC